MTKFIIYVFGSESSGTRFLTRALLQQKPLNLFGDDDHVQRIDKLGLDSPRYGDKNLILRRSFPHDGEYYDIDNLVNLALNAGYEPKLLWIVRSEPFVLTSKVENDHNPDLKAALDTHRIGLEFISSGITSAHLKGVYTRLITYESLVWETFPLIGSIVEDITGVKTPTTIDFEIRNQNQKHWRIL